MHVAHPFSDRIFLGTMRAIILTAFALTWTASIACGQDVPASPSADVLNAQFRQTVQPFFQTYCLSCHDNDKPKGDLDLSPFTTMEAVAADHKRWELVLDRLKVGDMPPAKATRQPTAEARQAAIDWVLSVRKYEATRNAGDPGPVPARRLSNAEYDCTIRDLTGVDIRPAAEFPVDPANEAGFDNSAESLTMSPALIKKYLEAARRVAEHVVFKPDGLAFAPHPMVAETDHDKYAVRQIIDFYQRQPIDLADYFEAAWRYRHRASLGKPTATLADVAAEVKVSPAYLATVWAVLIDEAEPVGPMAATRALWQELPPPQKGQPPTTVRAGCEEVRNFVLSVRKQLVAEVPNLSVPEVHKGSQSLVLWKNREMAANRRRYTGGARKLSLQGLPPQSRAGKAMALPQDANAIKAYEASFHRFCSIFPDAFVVSERARVYLDPKQEAKLTGRLLSAGFHSQMGYFRDDQPLYDLILDDARRLELDRLWQEFDYITDAPTRQHLGFLWFERTDSRFLRDPEFDFARAEDKDAASERKIAKLAELYLAKAERAGASQKALAVIADHFKRVNQNVRSVEHARIAAEPKHLAALQAFAERAFRRPLSTAEREDVIGFYRSVRQNEGLSHEDAIRDTIVCVLMSPNFSFRVNEPLPGPFIRSGNVSVHPLTDYTLASRLSYFLWSSMPDDELLRVAARGELQRPEVLVAQARRMLKDPRSRGLATEFAGNWLEFRRFQEHNSVDRERFASFTNELRQAMFEEPVRFFEHIARNDRSVLDFLYGDYTFGNPVLARHYGIPEPTGGSDQWSRVDDASRFGRGGLLPMAAFLTKNSPGLRTSPVKRGYWVTRRLLGEHIPPPPPDVPELPSDEAHLGEKTLRQTLADHRQIKSCAVCHDRFDAIGLVFEGYGAVGELRTNDFGGRPVETEAIFPDGSKGQGLDGLRAYIRDQRQKDFIDNLSRKLLAYGLSRTLLPSDDELIAQMSAKLAADNDRFSSLIESIVTSPQFRNLRAAEEPVKEGTP